MKRNGNGINIDWQKISVAIGLVALMIYFTLTATNFLTINNLLNIALQTSIIAVVAVGQTFVITGGGIDLSVGSVVAISSVVCATMLKGGSPIWLSVLLALGVGTFCGLINGLIIAYGKIAPFICSMGMMSIVRGVVYLITDGVPVAGLPRGFSRFGLGRLGDVVPYPVICMFVIAALLSVVLKKSRFGRSVFAVGSNEQTAYLSGIKIEKIKVYMYSLCALCCSVAGIILTSRLVSASPNAGTGYESDAIAAAVIGGASLVGGVGSVWGTIMGAFVMGVLRNGLNLVGLSYFLQQIAIGIVIIIAVLIDRVRFNRLAAER